MAKRFLTPINLPSNSSDPATASEGDLYFNTSLGVIKVYYGSACNPISSETITVSDTPPAARESAVVKLSLLGLNESEINAIVGGE